jgi:hypothetical protein
VIGHCATTDKLVKCIPVEIQTNHIGDCDE